MPKGERKLASIFLATKIKHCYHYFVEEYHYSVKKWYYSRGRGKKSKQEGKVRLKNGTLTCIVVLGQKEALDILYISS